VNAEVQLGFFSSIMMLALSVGAAAVFTPTTDPNMNGKMRAQKEWQSQLTSV
jgi:hypothetical protein